MDGLKKDISARIKELRGLLMLTPTQFAKETGVEPQTIRDYENGKSIPGGIFLHNLAKLGLNVEWLLTGSGWIDKTGEEYEKSRQIQKLKRDLKNYSDYIYIESFPEVRASAGPGQVSPTDQSIVQLKVNSADWRRYVGLDHKHIKLITVHGDSMKPTLSHGDQVMVDTACCNFIDDAIYCIQQGDNLRFKRIKLNLDGSIAVKSDNEKEGFFPEIYTADEAANFHIIGRVIPLKFGWFEI